MLIPEQITIAQLHQVLQLVMGWNDEHLNRFIIRGCVTVAIAAVRSSSSTAQTPSH
ncbi:hypothetical protein AB4Y45_41800 [Paraburkholderia sp. EG287A]|uniref:IS1096 element passenger TnpR family protein n=1 Tax=unclassified Paraburkholderia TaxID=2615204 RepID=UPI0034D32AD9